MNIRAAWQRAKHLVGIDRPKGYCAFCSQWSAPYPTVHNEEAFVDGRCHNERGPQSIYLTRCCPTCGAPCENFATYEDGGSHGYEVRFFCYDCKSEWGLQPTLQMCELVQQGDIPRWAEERFRSV